MVTETTGDGIGVTDTGMAVGAADGDEGTVVTLTCAYAVIRPDVTSIMPSIIMDITTDLLQELLITLTKRNFIHSF
jgi:hypothetical protein